MNIILGSTSTHKLDAVRQACQKIGLVVSVSGIKTSSGVNEQPVGFEETFKGALARANQARAKNKKALGIGIESGIFRFDKITLDMAVIVLINQKGLRFVTTSPGFEFPEECVRIAEARGFETTTVGSIITEQFGGDPTDPHSVLSGGKVKRSATLIKSIVIGLRQI